MTRWLRPGAAALTIVIASAILLLWIRGYSVSGTDLDVLAANLRWWTLPGLLALMAAHVFIAAVRWSSIEQALGAERPALRRAFGAGAIALGLGTFLPGFVTNVAARSVSNRIAGNGAVRGAVSGTIDQLSDLAVVALFIPAAILGIMSRSLSLYFLASIISAAIGYSALGVFPAILKALGRLSSRVDQASAGLIRTTTLRTIYALSLLRFTCLTAMTLLIHFATGAGTASAAILAVAPVTVAVSLAMLPGGLGISEWSFSAVFTALGVDPQQIVLFVLGNRIILTAIALMLMATAPLVTASGSPWRNGSRRPVRN